MTTEKELREILNSYGVGLEIKEFSKNDRVVTYPTRYTSRTLKQNIS